MNQSFYILVADDNVINQILMKRLMERAGYRVESVQNGKEVIQALEARHFDLVIMDCLMPEMDGFTATRIIRSSDPSRFDPKIPIIAITALATDRDREKCLAAGMTDYVSKPIVAESVLALAREYLVSDEPSIDHQALAPGQPPDPQPDEVQQEFQSDLLHNLSGRIISDAEQWQKDLEMFRNAGSMEALSALAHKIRGTADVIGKKELSRIAENLEMSGKSGNKSRASALSAELVSALRQLVLELNKEV